MSKIKKYSEQLFCNKRRIDKLIFLGRILYRTLLNTEKEDAISKLIVKPDHRAGNEEQKY